MAASSAQSASDASSSMASLRRPGELSFSAAGSSNEAASLGSAMLTPTSSTDTPSSPPAQQLGSRRALAKSGKYSLSLISKPTQGSMRRGERHLQWGSASSAGGVSPLHSAAARPTAGVSFTRRDVRPTAPAGALHGTERVKRTTNPAVAAAKRFEHHSPHTLHGNPAHGRHSSSLSDRRGMQSPSLSERDKQARYPEMRVSRSLVASHRGQDAEEYGFAELGGSSVSAGVSQATTPHRARSQLDENDARNRYQLYASSSSGQISQSLRSSSRGRATSPSRPMAVRPLAREPQPAASRSGSRGRSIRASASSSDLPSSTAASRGTYGRSPSPSRRAGGEAPPSPRSRGGSRGRGGERHIPGAERPMTPERSRGGQRSGGSGNLGGGTVVYGGGSNRASRPSPSRPGADEHSPGYTGRRQATQEAFSGQLSVPAAAAPASDAGRSWLPSSAGVGGWEDISSAAQPSGVPAAAYTHGAAASASHQQGSLSASRPRQSTAASSWAEHSHTTPPEPTLDGQGFVEMHPSGAGVRPKVGHGAALLAGIQSVGARNYSFESAVQKARFPSATATATLTVGSTLHARSTQGTVSSWPSSAPSDVIAPYSATDSSRSADSDVHGVRPNTSGNTSGQVAMTHAGAHSARGSTASSSNDATPLSPARGGVNSAPGTASDERSVTDGSKYTPEGLPVSVAHSYRQANTDTNTEGARAYGQIPLSPRHHPSEGGVPSPVTAPDTAVASLAPKAADWYTSSHITVVDEPSGSRRAGTVTVQQARTAASSAPPTEQVPTRVASLPATGAPMPAGQHPPPRLTSAVDMGSTGGGTSSAPNVSQAHSRSTVTPPTTEGGSHPGHSVVSPSHLTHHATAGASTAPHGDSPPGGDPHSPPSHVPESALAPAASAPAQPVNRRERSPVPEDIRRLWLYDFPEDVSTNCNPPAHALRCSMAGHQAMVALVAFSPDAHQQSTVSAVTGMQSPYRLLTHERAMVAIARGSRPDPSRPAPHRRQHGSMHAHPGALTQSSGNAAYYGAGTTAASRRSGGGIGGTPPSPFSGGTDASSSMMQRMRNTR